jgi:3D (Asp-Asp-Asp) domain-containing protein
MWDGPDVTESLKSFCNFLYLNTHISPLTSHFQKGMLMKLKIGSAQLVCIILIQIVLIDAFLIICFMKKINFKHESSPKAVVSKSENSRTKTAVLELKSSQIDKKASDKTLVKAEKFSVLKDFFITFGIDKPTVRDFRIKGRQSKQESFIATAYDLSYESCGKYPSHPEYGITFSGTPAVKGRTVAVDPGIIPLGSRLYIEFPMEYTYMNGWYIAEDTGSKVKGNIIDIFFGKSAPYETKKFGRRRINVQVFQDDGNIG